DRHSATCKPLCVRPASTVMKDSLIESARELIQQNDLIPADSRVVVAISGGQDSAALLHTLSALRAPLSFTPVAAHLNHEMRGKESDDDAEAVLAFCSSLGIACVLERCDVSAWSKRRHISVQEAAREARHAFLERTADAEGAER